MSEIMNTPEAAQHLRLGRSTLEKLRCFGGGPKFVKLGQRRVGYLRQDLDAWVAARPRLANTSEAAGDSRRA